MKERIDQVEFETVELQRFHIWGACYEIKIYSHGRVEYHGIENVKKVGHYSWEIDSVAIKAINESIQTYGYFTIKPRKYLNWRTCSPSCRTLVILKDGRGREIYNYYGNNEYPMKLRDFEAHIDSIIKIKNYIGSSKDIHSLVSMRNIQVGKLLISNTYGDYFIGDPEKKSKRIRSNLKSEISTDFGYVESLKFIDDNQPILPKYRIIVSFKSYPFINNIHNCYPTLCWFQDDLPENIKGVVMEKLLNISWNEYTKDEK